MNNKIKAYQKTLNQIRKEMKKIIVGQEKVVDGLLRAILADGHVLVEGIPGIAKTLIVRALAKITGCKFSRIQFTVDLLPTDIVGLTTYSEAKGFYTVKGPVFSNFLIADEINRAPPKSQSALLEAMAERQATIGKETFILDPPFFVMATQNPLEQEGVYPLPKAQIDRFLFKLYMGYPSFEEERGILKTNISIHKFSDFKLNSVLSPKKIIEMQETVKNIFLNKDVEDYIIRIVDATRNPKRYDVRLGKYIEWGGSPRASIGIFIASKAEALMQGKDFVTPQFVKEVAYDVLRHRLILTYEGQAENITPDEVISEILSKVPVP